MRLCLYIPKDLPNCHRDVMSHAEEDNSWLLKDANGWPKTSLHLCIAKLSIVTEGLLIVLTEGSMEGVVFAKYSCSQLIFCYHQSCFEVSHSEPFQKEPCLELWGSFLINLHSTYWTLNLAWRQSHRKCL